MSQTNISVIIPTLNAGTMINDLLTCLEHQSRVPDEIIVVDSSSDDHTRDFVREHPQVRLLVIDRKDFNHGGTRDMALRQSTGEFVLFLTQDALPKDFGYIASILEPFADEHVGLVYGRQIPKADAHAAESLVRSYTYGPQSFTVTLQDIEWMGIRAFRASDVCAAYRRSAYLQVGGFEDPVLTNEDMFIAARLLHAGWHVVYEAKAEVIHSHNFTWKQQFKRNYIQGVEIERHRDILGDAPLTGEGLSMVGYTVRHLFRQGRILEIVRFIIDCGFRYVGNRKGKNDAKRKS
ncbi:glycosyltransferase [Bifidobacterium pseudolongum]|uniref:glycosyltransferase family 2 protein n=1 Tax=Bifidobacterium pseudolongum TaxID=1694 RepID=UPI001F0EC475|nr:glycosyltransferase [Bifidobacterium pseudolongum]MCH4843200.1 glycosyltransferase [Bifidobacterium pseudolongum]